MMRRLKRLTALLLTVITAAALPGCGLSASSFFEENASPKLTKYTGYVFEAFDTIITVTAYCETQEAFDDLMDTAEAEFLRYHQLFDIYSASSDFNNLKTVNDGAGLAPVAVPEEIIDLLSFSKDMYTLTDGCINVAMGSVLKLWHEAREYNNAFPDDTRLPDADALSEASKHCSIDDLIINKENGTVFLCDKEMSLDVGGIAKGFATERVVQSLKEKGYTGFVINAGGNIRTFGTKSDGKSWVIAVTNPGLPGKGEFLGTVDVDSTSVVTSGSYQRYFEYEGRRYHHIVDPVSLMPENRCLSVTVVTENSGYADALSTALFNMETEDGLAFVEKLDGVEAMWVLCDGSEIYTDGFILKHE